MRVSVVSGDGLAVSGLLTVLRNVIDVGRQGWTRGRADPYRPGVLLASG
jgi:hypothetical protein